MDDFLDYMTKHSLGLYRNTANGTLLVRLHSDNMGKHENRAHLLACSDEPLALVTEHRLFGSRQHTLRFDGNAEAAIELPTGDYTVTVTTPGHAPYREFVNVADGQSSTVCAKLQATGTREQTLTDILTRSMVPHEDRQIRSLTLEDGQHVVLDGSAREYQLDLARIELKSIRAVKDVLGTPDTAFVDQHPRFGQASITRVDAKSTSQAALGVSQRAALQEYVYGNSRSVAHWERPLDEWISRNSIAIGLFVLEDIVVGPHAILDVGSHGLLCNTLSVHYTGQVRFKGAGPGKIEMNHYVRYGFLTSVATVTQPWTKMAHINPRNTYP